MKMLMQAQYVPDQAHASHELALQAQEDSNIPAVSGQTILMRSGSPLGPGRSSGSSHLSHSSPSQKYSFPLLGTSLIFMICCIRSSFDCHVALKPGAPAPTSASDAVTTPYCTLLLAMPVFFLLEQQSSSAFGNIGHKVAGHSAGNHMFSTRSTWCSKYSVLVLIPEEIKVP